MEALFARAMCITLDPDRSVCWFCWPLAEVKGDTDIHALYNNLQLF